MRRWKKSGEENKGMEREREREHTEHILSVHRVDGTPVEHFNDLVHELPGKRGGVREKCCPDEFDDQTVHKFVSLPLIGIQRMGRFAEKFGEKFKKMVTKSADLPG